MLVAVAALLSACGGDSNEDAGPRGSYELRVTGAEFPTEQDLGQTSLLRLGIRNDGERTVPEPTVTIGIAGERGRDSRLPFGIRDPQPGLATAERPVWVLAERYPRLAGSAEPGGASTSNAKTFALGALEPGETARLVWKLSAVRAGEYTLRYRVGVGFDGSAKARTGGEVVPGGSITVEITSELPETEVTDSGEVVEIGGSGG